MWWYRDAQKDSKSGRKAAAAAPRGGPAPRADLAPAVAGLLEGRPADPDAYLLMSLLVDSRIELADGSVSDGLTWLDAERVLASAAPAGSPPLRLYNRFSKEFGDGYTAREDVPPAHREALDRLRAALAAAPGVTSVVPRVSPVAAPTTPPC